MNRSRWTYISHRGEKSIINILHSPRLGHFAIVMNGKIVLLDKKVFGQDSYSFFIEDELCVVEIFIIDNQYHYRFRVDTTTKTALNQTRQEKRKQNLLYSLLTFSGLFIAVAITMVSIFVVQDNRLWDNVVNNAVLSVANVSIIQVQNNRFHAYYLYQDSTRQIQGFLDEFSDPNPVLDNGFPLQKNDEFLVTYSYKTKTNSKLHLNHPTHRTVQRYKALASTKYMVNNPTASPDYCDCIIDIAYTTKGWKGFALIYNAVTPTKNHKDFNSKTYQRWLNSKDFLEQEVNCWQFK